MKNIKDALVNKKNAFCYGNRILLPFKVDILKVIIENDIIMDFSCHSHDAEYKKHSNFTEIYFFKYKELKEVITKYETIKLVIVEDGDDIFDCKNHIKIAMHFKDEHKLLIEEINGDILFVE